MEALTNNQAVTVNLDTNTTITTLVDNFIEVNVALQNTFRDYHSTRHNINLSDTSIEIATYKRYTEQQINKTQIMCIIKNLQKTSDEEKLNFFYLSISNRNIEPLAIECLHNKIIENQSKNDQTTLKTTSKIDYLPEAYQKIFTDKTKRTDIPLSYNIAPDVPVNFIWLGSLLPDRYLKNIIRTGSAQPKKEIILWIDKKWLTSQQYSQMKLLHKLPALQNIDIKVLDINKAELEKISIGDKVKFQKALSFARDKLDNKAVASDLLRYALLAKGSDAINQASDSKKDRSSTGMIYMDTDRGPKTDTLLEWGEMQAPAGFLIPGNKSRLNADVLATSYARHPIFLSSFNKCVANLNDIGIQNKLVTQKGGLFMRSVLENTGVEILEDAISEFITVPEIPVCYPDHLTFKSEVAGPMFNDMTWFISPKTKTMPDLSATWKIQNASKQSSYSIRRLFQIPCR
jgi:hypothetical protein